MAANVVGLTLAGQFAVEGVDHGVKDRGLAGARRTGDGEDAVLPESNEVDLKEIRVGPKGLQ